MDPDTIPFDWDKEKELPAEVYDYDYTDESNLSILYTDITDLILTVISKFAYLIGFVKNTLAATFDGILPFVIGISVKILYKLHKKDFLLNTAKKLDSINPRRTVIWYDKNGRGHGLDGRVVKGSSKRTQSPTKVQPAP